MKRLDITLSDTFNISRSFSSRLIKEGKVFINGTVEMSPSKKIGENVRDTIYIDPNDLVREEIPDYIIPEDIPFSVIYEDENVLVINKPSGISVHTSDAEKKGTIINGLVYRLKENFPEGSVRPGIVHRIDKDTSGVLITAKNRQTQDFLSSQFKNREVEKEYMVIAEGLIASDLTIEKNIARNKKDRKKMGIYEDGRYALTRIHPVNSYFKDKIHTYTLLQAFPKTGRTHQIRIHLKSTGHAIVGDVIYNGEQNAHLMLHAKHLKIRIPNKGEMEFDVPVPVYFDEFLIGLNKID